MGNFYANVTLVGVRRSASRTSSTWPGRRRTSTPRPATSSCSRRWATRLELPALAGLLAGRLRVPALSVTVIDSDAAPARRPSTRSASCATSTTTRPATSATRRPTACRCGADGAPLPTGGDAALLVALTARGEEAAVEGTLRREWESYTFAEELHQALFEQLGLPLAAVGTGYELVADGQRPAGSGDWRHVTPA